MANKYYVVVIEWNYPTETGRDIVADFDSRDEAMAKAFETARDELDNFKQVAGDALSPEECEGSNGDVGGVIITPKNGLDEWFFIARVLEIEMFG